MAIVAASSLPLGPSHSQSSHAEGGLCHSTSHGVLKSFTRPTNDGRGVPDHAGMSFRRRNPPLGSKQFHWLSIGRNLCLWKVAVAADYSDSIPDSSSYMTKQGYHPLEELKACKKIRETNLTPAEIARTAVEANNNALLIFPGTVHNEPHEQISWVECEYVIDDYGDLYFEIFDSANILEDRAASNPVIVLIGMDMSMYEQRTTGEYSVSEGGINDDILFDDYFQALESENSDVSVDWRMPDSSGLIHPIYFAKCLSKVVNMAYNRKMDHPSNGVSILGCVRPVFADEESYIRRLFCYEDSDGYSSDWKDDEVSYIHSKSDGSNSSSTLYKLETLRIELFSVYGIQFSICKQNYNSNIEDTSFGLLQSEVSLRDFQDAEPDFLVHSTSAIVERFTEKGIRCDTALKSLCKKKGLNVEGACLIGLDSLGMDVRVFSGLEVQTHRFPFKVRVTSEVAAEKQIQQLLFPRSRRKKLRTHREAFRDLEAY